MVIDCLYFPRDNWLDCRHLSEDKKGEMKKMSEDEIENLTLEELREKLQKGYFSKGLVAKAKEKLGRELSEEQPSEEPFVIFYLDPAMNLPIAKENSIYHFKPVLENGYFNLWAYNPSETGTITHLQILFAEKDLKVLETPKSIAPKKLEIVRLRFLGRRGWNCEMQVSGEITYFPPSEVTRFKKEE
jgi:hypothetical protein